MMSSGSLTRAWAIFVRCRIPLEKRPISLFATSLKPTTPAPALLQVGFASSHPVKTSKRADELERCHPVVHLLVFGNKTDIGVRCRVLPRVHAEEFDLPCAGSKFPHEEFEQGGFSCAIHPEDAVTPPLKPRVMLLSAWMRP